MNYMQLIGLLVYNYNTLGDVHWALPFWRIRTFIVSDMKLLTNFNKNIVDVSTWIVPFNVLNNRLLKFYPCFRKKIYSRSWSIYLQQRDVMYFESLRLDRPIFSFFSAHPSQRKHIFLIIKTNQSEI